MTPIEAKAALAGLSVRLSDAMAALATAKEALDEAATATSTSAVDAVVAEAIVAAAALTRSVTLGDTMPVGIVATRIINDSRLALRMGNEPEWPGEIGHAYWEQVDFTPCAVCGGPLIWYEAGYVPGYRVCAKPPHHHMLAK